MDAAGSPDPNSYYSDASSGAGVGGEPTVSSGPPYEPQDSGAGSYDPDRPRWGAPAGIMVWVASVLAIIFIPAIAIGFLIVVRQVGGQRLTDRQYLEKFLQSPEVAMLAVGSTIVAHLITLAIVWAVASGLNRRSALKALGFRWMGPRPAMKFWFVIGVVILMYFAEIILGYLFPQSRETDFERLLKAGPGVRILVAFLAVFTAPLVEECVYRGMLFSGLRRGLREWPSILIVTALFAAVHLQQYWGAWAGIAGIAVLSFTLTVIRAKTKSLAPCIAVHMVFNAVSSLNILTHKY